MLRRLIVFPRAKCVPLLLLETSSQCRHNHCQNFKNFGSENAATMTMSTPHVLIVRRILEPLSGHEFEVCLLREKLHRYMLAPGTTVEMIG